MNGCTGPSPPPKAAGNKGGGVDKHEHHPRMGVASSHTGRPLRVHPEPPVVTAFFVDVCWFPRTAWMGLPSHLSTADLDPENIHVHLHCIAAMGRISLY